MRNWYYYLLRVGRPVVEALVIKVLSAADELWTQVDIGLNNTAKSPVAYYNENSCTIQVVSVVRF